MPEKLSALLAIVLAIAAISESVLIFIFRNLADKATGEKQKAGFTMISNIITLSAAFFLGLAVLLWTESLPADIMEAIDGPASAYAR